MARYSTLIRSNQLAIPTDVLVHHEGSIILLEPKSEAAQEWIDENLPEDIQYWAQAVVVEWRYAEDIIVGMRDDGLEVWD